MSSNILIPMPFTPFVLKAMAELGRNVLSGTSASCNVTSIANKEWLMVLALFPKPTATNTPTMRFNNDSATNYSDRYSKDGAAETTDVTQSGIIMWPTLATTMNEVFFIGFIHNIAGQEKTLQGWAVERNSANGTSAPHRHEVVGKWANTSNAITEVDVVASTSTFAIGTRVIVLGYDNADIVAIPFWQETGRSTLGGTSTNIQTTLSTTADFVWVDAYLLATGALQPELRLNNDSGANTYCDRGSISGGGDTTHTGATFGTICESLSVPQYVIGFIGSISTEFKLGIFFSIGQNTAGAGNAPSRCQNVVKYTGNASKITEVDFVPSTSSFAAGTEVVVYSGS